MSEELPEILLIRLEESDQGTIGFLIADGWQCWTLEPPDRNNTPNKSRIPVGDYKTTWYPSGRYGYKYLLHNVPGRTWVRIHKGNVAGDTALGFKTHSAGCILLGSSYGYLSGQRAVFNSGTTVRRFEEFMEKQPFNLKIIEQFGVL